MPVEIKELLIRAFVSEPPEDESEKETPRMKEANSAQDTLTIVANMLKQEKER